MIEIFGTKYYTWIGPYPILILIGLLVSLLLIYVLDYWIREKIFVVKKGILYSILILCVIEITLFWDVYWIGQEAKRLCETEGGLHVFKKIEVDTFPIIVENDERVIKRLLEKGYKYIYATTVNKNDYIRYSIVGNKLHHIKHLSHTIKYKVRYDQYSNIVNDYMKRNTLVIKDSLTGKILADSVVFSIYPGNIDARLLAKIGFHFSPWHCGNHGYDLAEKVFVPKQRSEY